MLFSRSYQRLNYNEFYKLQREIGNFILSVKGYKSDKVRFVFIKIILVLVLRIDYMRVKRIIVVVVIQVRNYFGLRVVVMGMERSGFKSYFRGKINKI